MNLIRLKDIIRCANEKKITPTEGQDTMDIQQAIGCLRDLFEHLADDRHASGINLPLRSVLNRCFFVYLSMVIIPACFCFARFMLCFASVLTILPFQNSL